MANFELFIEQLRQRGRVTNHRSVVVLSGNEQWAIDLLNHSIIADDSYWIGRGLWSSCLSASKAKSLLGNECQNLVFNCYSGFNPDAFGAVSGTLVGGGIVFLITPELKQWPEFADPDYRRYVATPQQVDRVSANFIERAVSIITRQRHCYVIEQDSLLPPIAPVQALPVTQAVEPPYANVGQRDAVAQIVKTVSGHRRRPLVISADRGRGKSAALGIAAAQLLMTRVSHIIVTAPSVAAVLALFKHAASLLEGASIDKLAVNWGDKSIRFVAPDQLISSLPICELLLVDEAAAIPTPMLATIARHYARVVFSTTIHGYEGTGRGFSLRFVKQLKTIAPSYRALELTEPIRWADDDPFEQLTYQLLGLHAKAANVDSLVGAPLGGRIKFSIVTQQQLLSDSALLAQLFGLLVLAHYQTSPSDFRQLLDAPDLTIFIATIDGQLIATALVLTEGGLERQLAHEIWLGKRRLRGHLLPQSLMAQLNLQQAGDYRYARIMRIAVQPQLHRTGIGRQLDGYIERWAQTDRLDFIGASFGATPELTRYWQGLDYQAVRLGVNRDSASGTHSVMVLKPVEHQKEGDQAAGERLILLARDSFYQGFNYALGAEFKRLEPAMVVCLLDNLPSGQALSAQDHLNIAVFIDSARPFEAVAYSVAHLVSSCGDKLSQLQIPQQQILVSKVMQQLDWQSCIELTAQSGRKAGESLLKQAVSELYRLSLSTPI